MIFSCKLAYVEPLCTNSYVLSGFCPRIPKQHLSEVVRIDIMNTSQKFFHYDKMPFTTEMDLAQNTL